MIKRISVNESVTITSLYFQNKKNFKSFPRRMQFGGATYTFNDGMELQVRKGSAITRIFDMTDGVANYQLRCDDAQNDWTLMAITQPV